MQGMPLHQSREMAHANMIQMWQQQQWQFPDVPGGHQAVRAVGTPPRRPAMDKGQPLPRSRRTKLTAWHCTRWERGRHEGADVRRGLISQPHKCTHCNSPRGAAPADAERWVGGDDEARTCQAPTSQKMRVYATHPSSRTCASTASSALRKVSAVGPGIFGRSRNWRHWALSGCWRVATASCWTRPAWPRAGRRTLALGRVFTLS